jgi:hypothetical protein
MIRKRIASCYEAVRFALQSLPGNALAFALAVLGLLGFGSVVRAESGVTLPTWGFDMEDYLQAGLDGIASPMGLIVGGAFLFLIVTICIRAARSKWKG